ncbi:CAP domain-containing protein [Sphaerisporangium perillae]|uniref:CAP domain-containing protein n=1 Tax=Sphaerisporangium perillae TaxID=2935860 RepID=UPI00200EEDD9|nr:CAP domain-containing protein [Sphaerisporangium perillae]
MDRHDRPSPGRYNESSPVPPPEYLTSEPPSPSGSRKRTIVISAAVAVFAAAVTAGGVITLTGGSDTVKPQSSEQGTGSGEAADAGSEDASTGSEDASSDDASSGDDASSEAAAGSAGSDYGSGGGSNDSSGGSGASGDSAGTPVGAKAEPVGDSESAKRKPNAGTDTMQTEVQGGPAPDGPAGYVEPYPQQPGRFSGLRPDFVPDLGPTAAPPATPTAKPSPSTTPKPKPKPSAKPTAKPSPKPTKTSAVVAAEDEVARLTNIARQEQGCGPLRIDEKLRKAARGHSDDMAAKGYFDHTSADGRSPWDRIKAAGYNSSMFAENIARGQATPEAVVKGWLNSPGHRANIMNCKLKAIGVGVHFGSGGPWWTQDFGSD